MLFYVIAIFVIIIDQTTKVFVRNYATLHERFTVFGLEFTYIENSGMAGGFLPGYARIFGVVAIGFVIFIFILRRQKAWQSRIHDLGFGFLVGGAIGNGFDRLVFGQVTDFIIRSGGVLNIADHALEIGIVLLIIYELWLQRKSKKISETDE